MGFDVIRLIAARTAGALAGDPASTTTTPSSPTWTPMFAPAPAIMKKLGRTSITSRSPDDAAREACLGGELRGSTAALRSPDQNAAHTTVAMLSERRAIRVRS